MASVRARSGSVRWAFNFGSWNPSEKQLLLASACLQPAEKERIRRFVYLKDSKASLVGRLLMRQYVGESWGQRTPVVLARDEKGKPYAEGEELKRFSFNVSHQGDYTVLAGETDKVVGVDVMKLEYGGGKSLADFFKVMTRQFAPEEWATIWGAWDTPDRDKLAMFCRHWCLKESYVKALGVGITVDLGKVRFRINTRRLSTGNVVRDTEVYVEGTKATDWHFEETLLDAEHCVAVAWKDGPRVDATDEATNDFHPPVDATDEATNGFQFLQFENLMESYDPIGDEDPEFSRNLLKKEEKPS